MIRRDAVIRDGSHAKRANAAPALEYLLQGWVCEYLILYAGQVVDDHFINGDSDSLVCKLEAEIRIFEICLGAVNKGDRNALNAHDAKLFPDILYDIIGEETNGRTRVENSGSVDRRSVEARYTESIQLNGVHDNILSPGNGCRK